MLCARVGVWVCRFLERGPTSTNPTPKKNPTGVLTIMVPDDDDALGLALELGDDGLEALDDVEVGLAARVPVSELVPFSRRELARVRLGDRCLGCLCVWWVTRCACVQSRVR